MAPPPSSGQASQVRVAPDSLMEMAKVFSAHYEQKKQPGWAKGATTTLGEMGGNLLKISVLFVTMTRMIAPIMEILSVIFDALMIAFLPEILNFIQHLVTGVTNLMDVAKGLPQDMMARSGSEIGGMLSGAIVFLVEQIVEGFLPLVLIVLDSILAIMADPAVWNTLIGLLVIAVELIIIAALGVVTALAQLITGFLTGDAEDGFGKIWDVAGQLLSGEGSSIFTSLGKVMDASVGLIIAIFETMFSDIAGMILVITTIIGTISGAVLGFMVAGPGGALAGAALGGAGGAAAGSWFGSKVSGWTSA